MADHFPLLAPGARPAGTMEVTAPFDNAVIATIEQADQAGVEKTLTTAYRLYRDRETWLSPAKRITILDRAIEIMRGRRDELAIEAAREGGKPLVDSEVETDRAIDSVRICVEELRTQRGTEIPMNVNTRST
jgi:acyl-CoA reductase-like NAD-dependent aldehyde dehydrogenase